ncbi:MAG TPA: hypothetical protein PKY87_13480 [Terricaulis sp.]|nr:hypothetical protein [Terricaulis sp.]
MSDDRELARLLADAAKAERPYAGFWPYEYDRQLTERDIAQELCNFLEIAGHVVSQERYETPDVVLSTSDRTVGIEVTELVCGEAIRANRADSSGLRRVHALWTVESVAAQIKERIATKDRKVSKTSRPFDALWLVISTDEPMITLEMAEKACAMCQGDAQHISRAYLVMSYRPGEARFPRGYPVYSIELV